MRTILNILVGFGTALSLLALLSCTKEDPTSYIPIQEEKQEQENGETTMPEKISITISGVTLQIVLENNVATRELVTALKVSPITYKASDYGGFEKVSALGRSLPTANSQITAQAGDVILYSGNQIVLFYGSNSWSYTRLGKIQYSTLDELKTFLKAGGGDVSVTLSLRPEDGGK